MKGALFGILFFLLTGCAASPLSLLTGGGPNVAANVQAGSENNQTLGQSNNTDLTIKDTSARTVEQSTGNTTVRTETVDVIEVTNVDWKLIALLCFFAGVLFPSHREIWRMINARFNRKKEPLVPP